MGRRARVPYGTFIIPRLPRQVPPPRTPEQVEQDAAIEADRRASVCALMQQLRDEAAGRIDDD